MQVSVFVFTVYKVLMCLGKFIISALLVIHYRSAPPVYSRPRLQQKTGQLSLSKKISRNSFHNIKLDCFLLSKLCALLIVQ